MLSPFYVAEYLLFIAIIIGLASYFEGNLILPIWATIDALLIIINQASKESRTIFVG